MRRDGSHYLSMLEIFDSMLPEMNVIRQRVDTVSYQLKYSNNYLRISCFCIRSCPNLNVLIRTREDYSYSAPEISTMIVN